MMKTRSTGVAAGVIGMLNAEGMTRVKYRNSRLGPMTCMARGASGAFQRSLGGPTTVNGEPSNLRTSASGSCTMFSMAFQPKVVPGSGGVTDGSSMKRR